MLHKYLVYVRYFLWVFFIFFSFLFFLNLNGKQNSSFSESKIEKDHPLKDKSLFTGTKSSVNIDFSEQKTKDNNLIISKNKLMQKDEDEFSDKTKLEEVENITYSTELENKDYDYLQNNYLLASTEDLAGYPLPGEKFDYFPILAEISDFSQTRQSYDGISEYSEFPETKEKGIEIDYSEKDGILIKEAAEKGVNVQSAQQGFYVEKAYDKGVKVKFAGEDGLFVDSSYDGVDVDMVEDDGVSVYRASGDGVVIYYAGDEGIDAIGERGNVLRSNNQGFYGLYVYSAGAYPQNPGLYVAGTIYATGTKSSLVETSKGKEPLYAVESPEVEFMCSGTARLKNGESKIKFDRLFRESISTQIPLRITLTPKGKYSELFVSQQSFEGFAVKSGSDEDVEFDWIAIGRRKGYEKKYPFEEVP